MMSETSFRFDIRNPEIWVFPTNSSNAWNMNERSLFFRPSLNDQHVEEPLVPLFGSD